MPMKGSGATTLREIDRFDGGVGWIAYPDETMQRASHALVGDDGVWLIDPVDADDLDELIETLAEPVAGVAVCLDRHKRDAAAVANRHDVAVHVPRWFSGVASEIDAPTEWIAKSLGDSGFEAFRIRDSSVPPWQECGLFDPDSKTMVVPESVGSASYFVTGDEPLGVHPMLRFSPPKRLVDRHPERILVGHGEGVLSDGTAVLSDAVTRSKRTALSLYGKTAKQFLLG